MGADRVARGGRREEQGHQSAGTLWVAGLYDEPRPGAPRQIGDEAIAETIRRTLETTADATHWSLRSMARAVGHAPSTIHRIWRAFGVQPHRSDDFQAFN